MLKSRDVPNGFTFCGDVPNYDGRRTRGGEERHKNLQAFVRTNGLISHNQITRGRLTRRKEYDGGLGGKEGNASNK